MNAYTISTILSAVIAILSCLMVFGLVRTTSELMQRTEYLSGIVTSLLVQNKISAMKEKGEEIPSALQELADELSERVKLSIETLDGGEL